MIGLTGVYFENEPAGLNQIGSKNYLISKYLILPEITAAVSSNKEKSFKSNYIRAAYNLSGASPGGGGGVGGTHWFGLRMLEILFPRT